MMNFFIFFSIFLFSANFVFAEVSGFTFTSNPQTIKPNEVSEKITVSASESLPQTGCLHLETSSPTGQFSSNSVNWESVTSLTMNKNTANRNFYYKDAIAGNYILTIKAALTTCAAWTSEQWTATQNIIVSGDTQQPQPEPQSQSQPQPQPTPGVGLTEAPPEPQIFANAGEDKTGVVGADIVFSGTAMGLKKEPLEGVRFLWNFGDGASKQGQKISHIYNYPGEYIVVLDVASGKYSASDRALVKIIPNQIKIAEANKEFVKLSNESNYVLDISEWYLRAGGKMFKLPASSLIKANSSLIIPSLNSGLETNNNVELLYPNASLAYSFVNTMPKTKELEPEPEPKINIIATTTPNIEQAAVGVITIEKQDFWAKKKWWFLAGTLGILAGAGFLVIKKIEI